MRYSPVGEESGMFYRTLSREKFSFAAGLCGSDPSPDDWHSTEPELMKRARGICAECPIRVECLDYSVRNNEGFGIWGGLDPEQRGFFHKTRF